MSSNVHTPENVRALRAESLTEPLSKRRPKLEQTFPASDAVAIDIERESHEREAPR
jgi:hypothetical protein